MRYKDISEIVDNNLCNSCGACTNVCAPKAISYQYDSVGHLFPRIDASLCTHCGLCSKVCPSNNFGKTLSTDIAKQKSPFHGTDLHCSYGRSNDEIVFAQSQSGGVTSALIIYALESGQIDVALLTTTSYETSIKGVALLAYTREDVLKSQKSKYVPIALLDGLKVIREKNLRFAIVGVSCQIQGLKNILDIQPKLHTLYQFSIGLICDRVMLNSSYDFLIEQSKLYGVNSFAFRDKQEGGYPGNVTLKTPKEKLVFSSKKRKQIKDLFTPARCRICFDKMNIFSDITIGDPHGIDGSDQTKGDSLVIARTTTGVSVLESSRDAIRTTPCSYQQVLTGQKIDTKEQEWGQYARMWMDSNYKLSGYLTNLEMYIGNTTHLQKKRLLRYAWRLRSISKTDLFKVVRFQIKVNKLKKLYTSIQKSLTRISR